MKKIFIISVIIMVVIVGIFLFNKRDNPTHNLSINSDCDKLESEVEDLIKKVKFCNSDSDCILDTTTSLGCPFGCYFIRSRQYDDGEYLSLITAKIKKYHKECPICKYKCPIPPESNNNIKCVNNKCSDTRFSE